MHVNTATAIRKRQYLIDLLTQGKKTAAEALHMLDTAHARVNIMDIEHEMERADVFDRELKRLQRLQNLQAKG